MLTINQIRITCSYHSSDLKHELSHLYMEHTNGLTKLETSYSKAKKYLKYLTKKSVSVESNNFLHFSSIILLGELFSKVSYRV